MPIKEYKVTADDFNANDKVSRILERFRGEITIIGDEAENGGVEDMKNKDHKKEIQESLDIIDRIRNRGKKMNKEAIAELYKIGDKTDEDWGNNDIE
ncbi:hypothetical protein [Pseudalkalibacillus decolorationis]|uniref:hypothetical protein n=1 Tax=Pseudalkalibacillus decolorationis TaxID=163879 RepID=UPI0021491B50|nr:hypothetical protein [Pseudalkalibacillus decolorationis]